MKQYLELLKKRAQVILLVLNLCVAGANTFIVLNRIETLGQKKLIFCQMNSAYTSICQEQ